MEELFFALFIIAIVAFIAYIYKTRVASTEYDLATEDILDEDSDESLVHKFGDKRYHPAFGLIILETLRSIRNEISKSSSNLETQSLLLTNQSTPKRHLQT